MTSFADWITTFKGQGLSAPGSSPLERLPNELLNKILTHVITPAPHRFWFTPHKLPGESSPACPSQSLIPFLLTSKTLSSSALFLLYREPKLKTHVPSAASISLLIDTLSQEPQLGSLIRTLDVTQFDQRHKDFTLSTSSLSLLPQLRDLRLSLTHIPDVKSLQTLIFHLPQLESLEIISGRPEWRLQIFRKAFESLPPCIKSSLTTLKITGTNSGESFYIPDFFEALLPKMAKLRVLDVSNSCITAEALAAIPTGTRLTHLNIWGCKQLDLDALTTFLTQHSAVKHSLVVLKAGSICDDTTPLMEHHITTILANAPSTLRSLDLSRSIMGTGNIPHLQRLCKQLEELSLGTNLFLEEIEEMLLKPEYDFGPEYRVSCADLDATKPDEKHASVLEPMKTAVARCKLRQRLDSVKLSRQRPLSPCGLSRLRYLNIGDIHKAEQGQIKQSVLLGRQTSPLEVIEMANIPWDDYLELPLLCRSIGWREQWEGNRVWVERMH